MTTRNAAIFRFAPSPNGHLHLGHAYSALLNEKMAREAGGRLLLRIEDIDTTRCTPALVADAIDDLAWLGLSFDPPLWRQSERFDTYIYAAEKLRAHNLAYPCLCSRTEIARAVMTEEERTGRPWPRDPDGAPLYPGTCRHRQAETAARMAAGEPAALRLDMAEALKRAPDSGKWRESGAGPSGETGAVRVDPGIWGDIVLLRKEVPASYHLAVVVDDAAQGITHVVRGQDLFFATSVHRLLQDLLGRDGVGHSAPRYHHHALLRDPQGRKLAKSLSSTPLRQARAEGVTAPDLRAALGF